MKKMIIEIQYINLPVIYVRMSLMLFNLSDVLARNLNL